MLKSINGIWYVAWVILFQLGTFDVLSAQPPREWKLTDIDGKQHVPFDDPTTLAVVLVFISTDCPIANAYQPELKKLSQKFIAQGIRWFMIHPDPDTTPERAAEHAKQFEISVPIVVDHNQSIARSVGARVTPEVHVYVKANEEAVYQGRINDLYATYGKKRVAATTHDLADALTATVDGQPVAVRKTEPVGCFIVFDDIDNGSRDRDNP
ncbi:MAG: redoxin domain-containing protein [Planctomycetaceae bacterium]|nr:redoxin domain-containing protein [Planctomycetaceae bacterium]